MSLILTCLIQTISMFGHILLNFLRKVRVLMIENIFNFGRSKLLYLHSPFSRKRDDSRRRSQGGVAELAPCGDGCEAPGLALCPIWKLPTLFGRVRQQSPAPLFLSLHVLCNPHIRQTNDLSVLFQRATCTQANRLGNPNPGLLEFELLNLRILTPTMQRG